MPAKILIVLCLLPALGCRALETAQPVDTAWARKIPLDPPAPDAASATPQQQPPAAARGAEESHPETQLETQRGVGVDRFIRNDRPRQPETPPPTLSAPLFGNSANAATAAPPRPSGVSADVPAGWTGAVIYCQPGCAPCEREKREIRAAGWRVGSTPDCHFLIVTLTTEEQFAARGVKFTPTTVYFRKSVEIANSRVEGYGSAKASLRLILERHPLALPTAQRAAMSPATGAEYCGVFSGNLSPIWYSTGPPCDAVDFGVPVIEAAPLVLAPREFVVQPADWPPALPGAPGIRTPPQAGFSFGVLGIPVIHGQWGWQ